MKNRKLIWILLPLLVIIWGLIFYKIFLYVKTDSVENKIVSIPTETDIDMGKNDELSIVANYRDPFHSDYSFEEQFASESNEFSEIKKEDLFNEIIQVNWPQIKYFGLINEKNTDKIIALVDINGSNFLIKPGQILGDLKFGTIYKDSLILILENQKRTIVKAPV